DCVYRDNNRTAKEAAYKSRDPFAGILPPEKNSLSRLYPVRPEPPRERSGRVKQVRIRPTHRSVPAPKDHGSLARGTRIAAEIVEDRLARHRSPSFPHPCRGWKYSVK